MKTVTSCKTLIALLLGAALVTAPSCTGRSRVQEEPVDSTARLPTDVQLVTADGSKLDFAKLLGKRVLLVTWASW